MKRKVLIILTIAILVSLIIIGCSPMEERQSNLESKTYDYAVFRITDEVYRITGRYPNRLHAGLAQVSTHGRILQITAITYDSDFGSETGELLVIIEPYW